MPCYDNNGKQLPYNNARLCGSFGGKWSPKYNIDQDSLPPQITQPDTRTRQINIKGEGIGDVSESRAGSLGSRVNPNVVTPLSNTQTQPPTTLPWQEEEFNALSKFPSINNTLKLPTEKPKEDKKKEKSFLENIQDKDWWFESMSDVPGDNRLARVSRMMAYISTPLSKRGDHPQDIRREQILNRDTLQANREKAYLNAQTELSKMQSVTTNKRMAAILKIASVNPQHLAKSIEEFIPAELNTSWFKMKDAEKQSLAMAIALRASQAMQLAATDEPPRQMPYQKALAMAATQILDERK